MVADAAGFRIESTLDGWALIAPAGWTVDLYPPHELKIAEQERDRLNALAAERRANGEADRG